MIPVIFRHLILEVKEPLVGLHLTKKVLPMSLTQSQEVRLVLVP